MQNWCVIAQKIAQIIILTYDSFMKEYDTLKAMITSQLAMSWMKGLAIGIPDSHFRYSGFKTMGCLYG